MRTHLNGMALAAFVALLAAFACRATAQAPVDPFGRRARARSPRDAVWGTLLLSDGEAHEGWIHLTAGQRLRMFDDKRKEPVHYQLAQLKELRVQVARNRVEQEWRFKESASDVKVFTGVEYARKDFDAVIVPAEGKERPLNIALGQPFFVTPLEGRRRRFILRPYLRGEADVPLEKLVHIAWMIFHEQGEGPDEKRRAEYLREMEKRGAARTAEAEAAEAAEQAEREAAVAAEVERSLAEAKADEEAAATGEPEADGEGEGEAPVAPDEGEK